MFREFYYSLVPDRALMERLERSPGALVIETINVCNANCIFCGYQYQQRRRRLLRDGTFEKALRDYVAMGGGDLALCAVVGDPLVDPRFVERVRLARSFSAIGRIDTITNGLNAHRFGAERLLTSGLTAMTVSTTGFDSESYRRIFRSDRFDQMKQNLLDLLRTNRALGRPVRIVVGLRVDRPVAEVLNDPGFAEVQELADAVEANRYFDNWSGRIKPGDLTGDMRLRPRAFVLMKARTPCWQLWSGTAVLADGTVTACACRDLDGNSDLVLGNVNETPLADLYRSEHLRRIREEWALGRTVPDICRDCTHYAPYTHLMLGEMRARLGDGAGRRDG